MTCLHNRSSWSEHWGMTTWLNYIIDTSQNKHRVTRHNIHRWIHLEVTNTSTSLASGNPNLHSRYWLVSTSFPSSLQVIFLFFITGSTSSWLLAHHCWIITRSASSSSLDHLIWITWSGSSSSLDHLIWITWSGSSSSLDHLIWITWSRSSILDHHHNWIVT